MPDIDDIWDDDEDTEYLRSIGISRPQGIIGAAGPELVHIAIDELSALRTELDKLREENGRLREALEPFGKRADYFDRKIEETGKQPREWRENDYLADDPPTDIYIGQLRKARAALTKEPTP